MVILVSNNDLTMCAEQVINVFIESLVVCVHAHLLKDFFVLSNLTPN